MNWRFSQSCLHVAAGLALAVPLVANYYSWSSYNEQIARSVMSSPFIHVAAAIQGTGLELAEWHRAHPEHWWQDWAQIGVGLLPFAVIAAVALEMFAWRLRRANGTATYR